MFNLFSPNTAYAQTINSSSPIITFVGKVDNYIVNPLIIFMFSLALMYFLYGVLDFFINSSSAGEKDTGKQHMMWGIVGMFLMIAVFGILRLIEHTFGLGANDLIG